MQRILSRGEIESLDHTAIARLQLPDSRSVFATRAARLRQLAADGPLAGYLALMAHLADAQQAAMAGCTAPGPDEARIALAQAHGMPPLAPAGWRRDPVWLDVLQALARHVGHAGEDVPPAAARACAALLQRAGQAPAGLEAMADALLEGRSVADGAAAPFVMAALQVYWTGLASRFDPGQLPVASPAGVCPLCGSLPVASVVRVGGQFDGYRYLCCGLCASQWHMVRVKCTHCEDTETVAYHAIEDGPQAVKAESCDRCHSYRKIFYQEKDLYVEPVADDLASLMLDILMGEAGYARASANPLLWQEEQAGA